MLMIRTMADETEEALLEQLKDFHKKLFEMRNNSFLVDFVIRIGETEIPVHRLVLATSSEYFRGMFSTSSKEALSNQVNFSDISVCTMEAIIDYCYTCQIDLTDDNVERILIAASKLLIEPLQDECSYYIVQRIDATNCLGIASLSDSYNIKPLHTVAFQFCIDKFETVVEEKEFLDSDDHMLETLLANDKLNITESKLFQSLLSWTQRDIETRFDSFDRLVKHIRFVQIEPAKLIAFGSNELVHKSENCKILFDQAKNYHLLKDYPSLKNKIVDIELRPRDNLNNRQRIYAIGGWTNLDKAIAKVEIYNPNLNQWTEGKPMSERRCGLGCASYEGSIYAVGGHNGQSFLSSVERFDRRQEEWLSDVPNMSSARTSAGTLVLDGYLYAIGGQTTEGATNIVEKLDLNSNTWSKCAPLLKKRLGASIAVLNGSIYVVGGAGCSGSTVFDTVERYDPAKDVWTYVASMLTARKHLGCTSHNGKIYAIAGRKGGIELNTAEVYDPQADLWRELPKMCMKRSGVGVVELGGLIYVIGGQSDDTFLNAVETYNPQTMEWCLKKPMTSGRVGCGLAVFELSRVGCLNSFM